jgi:hypothetical protein
MVTVSSTVYSTTSESRFVFSTRAKVRWILKEDGSKFYGEGYVFQPSKDEYIRKGTKGYIGGLRLPE